jgi:hypothetical protein
MAETWVNYWYLGKDGKLVKTERVPKSRHFYVYETAERPSPQISRHTFYCPQTGETRTLDALCEEDRMVKRRQVVKGMLMSSE